MPLKHLKSIVFTFLFISSLLVVTGCVKSPIENAIEDLVDANDDDDMDADDGGGNDNDGGNDDGNNDDTEQPIPSLTAKVNGTDFTSSRLIIEPLVAANVVFTTNGYLLNIVAFDTQLSLKSNKLIALYISGFDFDEVVADAEFNNPNPSTILALEPGAYAIYSEDLNTDDDIDGNDIEIVEAISIKITSIDKELQLISGEFSFIGIDEDTNERYEITDGVFSNLEYEIQ